MANRTRLDSLRVGEKFSFHPGGTKWEHLGFDAQSGMQKYVMANHGSYVRLAYGSEYVIPLDPPPPVPER